ncbi:MAG: hypothetical protein KBS40_06250 [Bacteroidales bacterium]|nr:hypothetical protein [Bacteroidales bacterium]
MTQEQINALQVAIENNFFMPNHSQLAKVLGYNGRMVFTRFLKAQINRNAFDRLWEKIKYSFDLNDAVMLYIPELWDLSEGMAQCVKKEQFVELVQYKHINEVPADLRVRLDALYKEDYLLYSYALALFYAKAADCNPNIMKGALALVEVIQQVDAVLFKQYPEEFSAHKVAMDLLTLVQEVSSPGWYNLMHAIGTIICYYTHPFYIDERIAKDYRSMPFGDDSYWIADGQLTVDDAQCTMWLLEPYDDDRGVFNVLKIEADLSQPVQDEQCTFQRWGFFKNEDSMRCAIPQGIKMLHSAYYAFEYDETTRTLCFELQKKRCSPSPIMLPTTLKMIDDDSPWMSWVQANQEDIMTIFQTRGIAAFGFVKTDIRVTDVAISRHVLVLHTKRVGEADARLYSLDMEQYPSLKKITPWDEVAVFRSQADGDLYAYWYMIGVSVKLVNL